MYFAPFIVRAEHERKVPVVIERATAEDLKATAKVPKWQTDWTSEYLADEKIEKYSLKTKEGNLIALGAYRVMGRKAYVYILYLESAPASNPTLTAKREYYGIGEVMMLLASSFRLTAAAAAMFCLKPRHRTCQALRKRLPRPPGGNAEQRRPAALYAGR